MKEFLNVEEQPISCDCLSPEHNFNLSYFDSEDYYLFLTKFLSTQNGFFGRIKVALKYIFGYKSWEGHFDETAISPKEAVKMRDFINKFLKKENVGSSANSIEDRLQKTWDTPEEDEAWKEL